MSKYEDLPAFPQPQMTTPNGEWDFPWNGHGMGGLSMRDLFAASVAGHLSVCIDYTDSRSGTRYLWAPSRVARRAYVIAGAMLKERSR